jgi:hypothetical protein
MAERVVDELEAVEVHEQHRDRPLVALGQRHREAKTVVGEQPVRQARQGVGRDELVEPRVGVAQRHLLARIGEQRGDVDPPAAPVGEVADVDPPARRQLDEPGGGVGCEPAGGLGRGPAGDGGGRRVPGDEPASVVVDRQPVPHASEELVADRRRAPSGHDPTQPTKHTHSVRAITP